MKTYNPIDRGMYAFTKYKKGEFLVYIDSDELCYNFMQLPDRLPMSLTKNTFKESYKGKVFEYLEQLPEDVYEICIANIHKT